MEESKKISLINRIGTGIIYQKHEGRLYRLVSPTRESKALSETIYEEVLSRSRFDELMTREQASFFLASKKIWTPEDEKGLKDLYKYLEDLKIRLYKALFNSAEQVAIRRSIKTVNKSIEKSMAKKYSLEHMTLENFAETIRDEFLIAVSIKDEDDRCLYNYHNFWASDSVVLNKFLSFFSKNIIKTEDFREIARTEPFRSSWSIGKENVFGKPAVDLTADQKTLILYSKMYDNVYESIDRPSDVVIEDDDMLDGWFAEQRREAEKQRGDKEVDSIIASRGASNKAGEVFVLSKSKEEADKIRERNSLDAKMKMRQREAAINESGRLEEHQLPDVKLDLRNKAMKQMAERFKGK